ncbi:MAG: Acg family FMN-binding oxidoreductase [Cyclobacteriaceae bacterium]|jgi:hypothetical protein
MERRTFLLHTGTLITATMLAQCGLGADKNALSSKRRPNPDDFSTPALKAIAFGVNAPNPHNTQAWKFRLQSDSSFTMYVDETRLLTATDPTARQIHIGCGCFLSVMAAGISSQGYKAQIALLPDGEYSIAQVGVLPVAHITLIPAQDAVDPLSEAIFARKTNRLAYSNQILSTEEFDMMVEQCKPQHATIRHIAHSAVTDHVNVLCEGMVVESKTYETYDESRIWFRESDTRIEQLRDGINLPAGGTTGLKKFFAEMMLKGLDAKNWHKPSTISHYLSSYEKRVKSTNSLVQFITETNTQTDWIKAGMDYARFQLAITLRHYYIHPMSQVLQEFASMDKLREQYNQLNGIRGDQKIQMVVRIGKADTPFFSYRRNVDDLILN